MDMSFFTGDGFMAFLKSMAFGGGLGLYALARQKVMERRAEERPEDLLFWQEPGRKGLRRLCDAWRRPPGSGRGTSGCTFPGSWSA